MHFSKTYSQLLLTLPPELRENAIQYRQLKKLINQLVQELSSLGLSPIVLQQLLTQQNPASLTAQIEEIRQQCDRVSDSDGDHQRHATVVYEFTGTSSQIEPRLRLSVEYPTDATDIASEHTTTPDSILEALQLHSRALASNTSLVDICYSSKNTHNLIIPLQSDTAFFQLLNTALASLAEHLNTVHGGFTSTLQSLAYAISATARPTSSSAPRSFSAYSIAVSNAATLRPRSGSRNTDLYSWREIFQMYVEGEIFESFGERTRGERSVEETETRMRRFEERMQEKRSKLKLAGSKDALDIFMRMNFFILDLKRFQFANAEATRKILKKHTKRTALPLPSYLLSVWNGPLPAPPPLAELALFPQPSTSLPRLLVQAIGEILLPIVPHVDDYSCLICTSLAFKPIRLGCSHLFCVRCLVKLQRLGKANCPICRAPTVLKANHTNVDYALLNFMADWFPRESRAKLSSNEREAAKEELEELGLSEGCRVM
ncbi:SPX domain-containing protein [Suillus subaureus]|uniref:SPX domain-containing protein n=1 Tax=Suillus subaureus TaxID=48587 RepID=A0A9P7E430_9AGAM|nr:SPX domain-containing protein [Suillus subaureus]KAG1810588.1 SPX domain-containing protein [Suillus subaureus]